MIKVIKNEKQMMEKTIKEWAINMVRTYTWLTIKFEYNERFRTILIDLVYPPQYGNDEDFHRDALAFNDKMCKVYGDDAPLFTDNEKLFKLSNAAHVVCANSYSVTETLTLAFGLKCIGGWNKSKTPTTSSCEVEGVKTSTCDYVFDIAA